MMAARLHLIIFAFIGAALAAPPAAADPKISPQALSPITKKDYPKTYAQWGPAGAKRINLLAPLAAQKIAKSAECDRVELVELSDQRSVPGKEIVFFADCSNMKRFYVSEKELGDARALESQTTKMQAIPDQQALEACERAIARQLENSLTMRKDVTSLSVRRAPSTGNIAVEFGFDAKNNFGAALPHKARCIITEKGVEDAFISKR